MLRACVCLLAASFAVSGAASKIEFNRDIRPILSDKCFHCHGPDSKNKNIPLRLDRQEDAFRDLGGGRHAIVAGKPAESTLAQRISAPKPAMRMPPVASGYSLTQQQIELLTRWIEQGAEWQGHWSFLPPSRPALPAVKNTAWVRNEIDRFVLARLESEGLSPSPEAPKETLLRRLSLDLTGLPPSVKEVERFLSDPSPEAYERAVDRLLASPGYGERMAARWLDAARYADSNGYQYDGERQMWRWRDWVIDAFNRNQPFDRFALEQIAGDMLPKATLDQRIATGFNRNHRANTEDGIIAEEYAVEYVVDRVETTSTVFLGLTLGCARCHNHKYDPFSQKEFYQVFAYFNNIPELGRAMKYGNSPPVIPAPTREQQHKMADLQGRIRGAAEKLRGQAPAIEKDQKAWESGLSPSEPLFWGPSAGLNQWQAKESGGAVPQAPGHLNKAWSFNGKTYLDAGNAGAFDIDDRFSLAAWIYSDGVPDGSIITRMADGPTGKGYGLHMDHGKVHFHLTSNYADDAIRLETEQTIAPKEWHHIVVTYTGSSMAEGVQVYLDGQPAKCKILLDTLYRPFRNAGKLFEKPTRIGAGWGPERQFRGLIDDPRLYARTLNEDEITSLALGRSLNEIAAKPEASRSAAESRQLRWYFLEHAASPEVRASWSEYRKLEAEREALERTFPTVMVMKEREQPKPTFVLKRGAYDQPGDPVQPGLPQALPALPAGAPNNRLGFAQWVVSPSNPLMARVTVNRFWQSFFGSGIVRTTEDFGTQGEWPSHPELLDWLATDFADGGWNVKAMLKQIVMSATYRQSSKVTPESMQKDPENILLGRGARFRLPAEMIRDQALSISGLLSGRVGGPSVKPYQPEGLWKEVTMQDSDYVQSRGADLYRRSIYTFWKRTVAPPMLMNFDASGRESCVVRMTRTNTPLQALDLMNDVTFLEASRLIAQRMMREGGTNREARLRYGFRLILARDPKPEEVEVLSGSLGYHADYFAGKPEALGKFLAQGESGSDPSLDRRELAAYTAVASLLLNLDEAVTRE